MTFQIIDDEIVGYIDIKAVPERVFDALTRPNEWWGSPDSYTVTATSMEPFVGGRWRSDGVSNDGSTFSVSGVVVEYNRPHRLSYTWNKSWGEPSPETTVTYQLDPIEGGTRVGLRHGSFAGQRESAEMHNQGWQQVFGWLKGYSEARSEETVAA